MFKFLPKNVKNAFYLDSDIIVLDDLSKIYIDFISSKKIFASVADSSIYREWKKYNIFFCRYKEFQGFIDNRFKFGYFNDGFYIANISKSKKYKIFEQCIRFLKKYPNPKFADMDVLNAIFSQKYHKLFYWLSPKYNVFAYEKFRSRDWIKKNNFYSYKTSKLSAKKPTISHFVGKFKPWKNRILCAQSKKWYKYNKILLNLYKNNIN